MVVRSLFIQATNNFERMLSLGFLFALWPAIKAAYGDAAGRRKAIVRHLSFFNTQPYLANSILGVVANVELSERPRDAGLDEDIEHIKRAMMGAFGALGDDLFWAGLMPASALVAMIVYALQPDLALAAAVGALIIYNIFHYWARVRLFELSLRLGRRVTRYFRLLHLPQLVVGVKIAAAFLLGVFATAVVWRGAAGIPSPLPGGVMTAAGAAAAFGLMSVGVKPGMTWLVVMGAAVVIGVSWSCQ